MRRFFRNAWNRVKRIFTRKKTAPTLPPVRKLKMKKVKVWTSRENFRTLKTDEPANVLVQNRRDLGIIAEPTNKVIECELTTLQLIDEPLENTSDKRLILDIESRKNFSAKDNAKIDEAKRIYEIVMNHPYYWQLVRENWHKMTEKRGFTFEKFKALVLAGDCKFTEADGETDVQLVMYHKPYSNVVGYIITNKDNRIYTNRKFFVTPLRIASNLNHESLHLMGFSHYGTHSTSIPYMAGNTLFQKAWKAIEAGRV